MQYLKTHYVFNKTILSFKQAIHLLFIITIACFFYKLLEYQSLKHSAALFIGIPVMMGVALAVGSQQKHVTFNVLSGLSLGLVASFLYLNEGSFCVPMTAPLFLISGLVISFSFTRLRKSKYFKSIYLLPVLLLALFSIEGISNFTSFNRIESISTSKETILTPHDIEHSLSLNKQFITLPSLLSWGFPQPEQVIGSGSNLGDKRDVYFSGGEGKPGHAVFEITRRSQNSITYTLLKDESHINHWLNWKTSEVRWQASKSGKTVITWTIDYERKLDPSWYFGPLQSYAVELAAETLIDNLIL